MIYSKKFKNNVIERSKVIKEGLKTLFDKEDHQTYDDFILDNSKIDAALDNLEKVETLNREWFADKWFKVDPYYDSEIIKHIGIFTNYLEKFTTPVPEYIKDGMISGKAFLDVRDFMKNEIPYTPEMIINSNDTATGVINDKLVYFDNGFTMDSYGNIYDVKKHCIFNPNDASQKIAFIDILNEKAITENGIRIDLPDDFIDKFIKNNPNVPHERIDELKKIIDASDKTASDVPSVPCIAVIKNVPITEADKKLVVLPVDLYAGDIYDMPIDIISQIKTHKEMKEMDMCNMTTVPYNELMHLLFLGGGKRGQKPLCNEEITSKDIIFLPDGTAAYSNNNASITINRPGCGSKKYKTGHVCMWSQENQIGMQHSFLQVLYKICNLVLIFYANIPPLIGFKKFKVFPGLCIGGLLEQMICSYQESISKRINDLFQCNPMQYPSDSSQSGFENQLYAKGATVSTCEDLDKIVSAMVGDRYVVEVVDTSITGLSNPAMGVFVLDPADTLVNNFPWKYKVWRGKPYDPNSNNDTETESKDKIVYNNPLVIEALEHTDMLGVDSITVALLALQNEYLKKNNLITITDVENNLDASIRTAYSNVLVNLRYEIPSYAELLTYEIDAMSKYGNYESKAFIDKFLKYFEILVINGIYKPIDLELCKRIYYSEEVDAKGGISVTTFTYYDFSAYDYKEYLIPYRDKIPYYDLRKFGELAIPVETINEDFELTQQQLTELGYDSSKYLTISTIRDYVNISDNSQELNNDIKANLDYTDMELNWDGYEQDIIDHVNNRCYYAIDEKKIFNI